jgi:hypothetical protein
LEKQKFEKGDKPKKKQAGKFKGKLRVEADVSQNNFNQIFSANSQIIFRMITHPRPTNTVMTTNTMISCSFPFPFGLFLRSNLKLQNFLLLSNFVQIKKMRIS